MALSQKRKDLFWLQYTKPVKHGYRFLSNKKVQWKTLEKISQKVSQQHQGYAVGEVIDVLSEVVNNK